MKILMATNTFAPLVGGLEKSVETFAEEYRERGHQVVVITPEADGRPEDERDVIRMPAIQNIVGTEFSLKLPLPGVLTEALGDFHPDIVHAHHPFLIGATALRLAYKLESPLVFTHHTLFEQNTHYLPGVGESESMKRFVVELATGFANLSDMVFAPSGSVRDLLIERGVESPIEIVPTGIDVVFFSKGNGAAVREKLSIPSEAFVVGHLGRLAPEKNLEFLSDAVACCLKKNTSAYYLIAGKGPSEDAIRERFEKEGLGDRLKFAGVVQGQDLVDTYHAMDVFAFASHSETQGMVLAEAMAAGVPVVGIDASGVRDVVLDGKNGRLLYGESPEEFCSALVGIGALDKSAREAFAAAARATAEEFSKARCTEKALSVYARMLREDFRRRLREDDSNWGKSIRRVKAEWDLMKTFTKATKEAVIKADTSVV